MDTINHRIYRICKQIKQGDQHQRGFSLVELVASLMIAGILAVALSTIVVTAMDGYVLSRDAADISQKGQLGLARMRIEVLNATSITTATANKLVFSNSNGDYELDKPLNNTVITLKQDGGSPKTLVDKILSNYGTDQLFAYQKKPGDGTWNDTDDLTDLYTIDITLKFDHGATILQTSINPRANQLRVAPRML